MHCTFFVTKISWTSPEAVHGPTRRTNTRVNADSVCWHPIAPQLRELTNETGAIANKPDIPYYYVH